MSSRICIITIWVCFVMLLCLGIIMVASTSTVVKIGAGGDPYALLRGQIFYAIIGICMALVLSLVDYRLYRRFVIYIWLGCVLLLILCFVPGIGLRLNGEARWIQVASARFQPSEMAKIALMISLAHWYARHREYSKSILKGFLVPGLIFGFPLILILVEKDMGTAAALGLAGFGVMLVAGTRWWVLALALLLGALVLFQFTTDNPNRMARIEAWMKPELYKQEQALQQWVAEKAFERGGVTGVGLGEGIEKYGSLPVAHTDFIYAKIGSELGFIGTLSVVLLFTTMTTAAITLALQTREHFGRYLCLGLILAIYTPAMLNMMVVTALVPNTGLPLPFISHGGTNLVFSIAAIGIITSIQRRLPVLSDYVPLNKSTL